MKKMKATTLRKIKGRVLQPTRKTGCQNRLIAFLNSDKIVRIATKLVVGNRLKNTMCHTLMDSYRLLNHALKIKLK